jgi:hypothetical protein
MAVDKMKILPSLGDIERGIENGTPKRVLYQELSEIGSTAKINPVREGSLKTTLQDYADKINKESAGNNRK